MKSKLVTEKVNCGAVGFLTPATASSEDRFSTAVFRFSTAFGQPRSQHRNQMKEDEGGSQTEAEAKVGNPGLCGGISLGFSPNAALLWRGTFHDFVTPEFRNTEFAVCSTVEED
jgi:hypothetical protein